MDLLNNKPMRPRVSSLVRWLDCNPRFEEASREELVRLLELLKITQEDIATVLQQKKFRCGCGCGEPPEPNPVKWSDSRFRCPQCSHAPTGPAVEDSGGVH